VPFGFQVQLDRKAKVTFVLALVLAVVLLYFSLRGLDFAEIGKTLAAARLWPLFAALLLEVLALWLRSFRWRVLLGANAKVPLMDVFWANSIGYLGNNVLPARMGELMRVEILKRTQSVSRSYILATALIERVMDAGVLVLLTSVALLVLPGLPVWLERASRVFSLLSGIGILVLFLLPHAESRLLSYLNRSPRGSEILSRFLEGLRSLHSWARSIVFLLLTLVIWPVDSMAGVLVAQSISVEMPFLTALIVLAALGLSSAAPSTPGFVGVFQFVAVNVLSPFGIGREMAIAWVLLFQAICYVVQCGFGFGGILRFSRSSLAVARTEPAA
jgi:uncharacterized protein (TIRG00374 family)